MDGDEAAPERRPPGGEGNAFLGSLTAALRERILRRATVVRLDVRDSIYARDELVEQVYLPIDGVISNVLQLLDGSQLEISIVGREGIVGVPAAFTRGVSIGTLYAQVAGSAWRLPRTALASIVRDDPPAIQPFVQYVETQINQFAQYGACNRLHTLDKRFARWLLIAHDRAVGDEIRLTQEFLALMLGIQRPAVSITASRLQDLGIISYVRGRISIVDRPALESQACECYFSVEDRFERRMGYSIRKSRVEAPP